jgi:predicted glycoside hydrolase/deacetylase ChbG (UPF0249 family)
MRSLVRVLALLAAAALGAAAPAPAQPSARAELLLRVDDIGMNHAKNLALEQLAATGMPLSASVIFAGPWYQEAVEILRRSPQIAVGVHLTLNSEWRGYRWGPVLGGGGVPSLVDSVGYFHSSTAGFLASRYDLAEVERELAAQIERALRSGLAITYVDYHMGTSVATPALREVTERLAARYGLGMSEYFGEAYESFFATPVAGKKPAFLAYVGQLSPDSLHLLVLHAAVGTEDMRALVDMNNAAQNTAAGEPMVSLHRETELAMLLSPEFAQLRRSGRFVLVSYADVVKRKGLRAMARPR